MRLRKRGRSWLDIIAEPTATAARVMGAPLLEKPSRETLSVLLTCGYTFLGQGERQRDVGICSPIPLLRGFMRSGGIPPPHLIICRGGCGPQHLQAMDLGAWLVELLSSPDPICLLGRDHGRGPWSPHSICPTPSIQDGQQEQGHTYRRGLETCELNLVNSPGAVHSVPSWGKEGGACESTGDTTGQAGTRPKPHRAVRISPPPPSGSMPCCRKALQAGGYPRSCIPGPACPQLVALLPQELVTSPQHQDPKNAGVR